MVDFTIGINVRDGEIGVTMILEDREETFTIEQAECFHDVLGLQINLAKTLTIEEAESFQDILGLQINLAKNLTHPEGKPPRVLDYHQDAASRFR